MSHVIAGGATAQTKNMAGKRLGVKKFDGEFVKNGTVLVRQRGSVSYPGRNTKMSRDYTIYATVDGYVNFRRMTGNKRGKFYVDVNPEKVTGKLKLDTAKEAKVVEKKVTVKKEVKVVEKKSTVKKAPVKKTSVKKTVKK